MKRFLKSRLFQLTGLAFLGAAGCSAAVIGFLEHHRLGEKRRDAANVAQAQLRSLDSSIDLALSATYALAALVQQGHGTIADFDKTAAEMLKLYPGVGALQLAPGGVIKHIVPLAGNERALGHELLKDPARNKEAFLARESGRLTLAGPFSLIQGGVGAIGRLPVFLPDPKGGERFWGFTTVLIRFPDVLDAAGLSQLARRGYLYELYRIHPDSGKKQVIAASASGASIDPVELTVAVPNGSWTLALAPEQGWHSPASIVVEILLGLLVSLMVALIVNLLLRQPIALREEVAHRTRELKESVDRFFLLLDSAAQGIYGIDTEGRCTFINRSALASLGFSASETVLGRNMHQLVHHKKGDGTSYPQVDCPIYRAFKSGDQVHCDDEFFWRADGTSFPTEYWSYPIKNTEGAIVGAVVSFLDITQRLEHKRLSEQLLHSQKMEAVGLLAGGIAHDFNNILTAIVGYGELLKELIKDVPKAVDFTEHILSSADRAGKLTKQLLLYSRKQAPVRVSADLNEVVTGMELLLRRVIGEQVELRKNLWPEKIMVEVDVNQIEQVLMNLCINARDAMPQGGIITIGTRVISIEDSLISYFGVGSAGDYACLSVADTGIGMDRETQERIFEPFFTTKEQGAGTGLGLSTAYGVLRRHNGSIKVYSEPGIGTTFRLMLKLSESVPVPSPHVEPEGRLPSRENREKILIADDEEFIRDVLYETLTAAGYRVKVAVDGLDAVAKIQAEKEGIDLLILDVIMPGVNGRQIWERSKEIMPGCRVLFMSGYTADIMESKGNISGDVRLLEKPFSCKEMLQVVREVLDQA